MKCKLFIDESGDEGIDPLNNKQSPFFFLGACLINEKYLREVSQIIFEIENELGIKELHFSKMKHEYKIFSCSKFLEIPMTSFGLISCKKGLDAGGYRTQITGQKGFFYNKNVHYLLEKVGLYCKQTNSDITGIIFDKIENKNYRQLRNYLWSIKDQPYHNKAKLLENIDPDNVCPLNKKEEPALKIADCIANSIYRSCSPHRYGGTEHRYLNLLKERFFCDKNGMIANYGIKAVRSFRDIRINIEDKKFLLNLKNESHINNSFAKIA